MIIVFLKYGNTTKMLMVFLENHIKIKKDSSFLVKCSFFKTWKHFYIYMIFYKYNIFNCSMIKFVVQLILSKTRCYFGKQMKQ